MNNNTEEIDKINNDIMKEMKEDDFDVSISSVYDVVDRIYELISTDLDCASLIFRAIRDDVSINVTDWTTLYSITENDNWNRIQGYCRIIEDITSRSYIPESTSPYSERSALVETLYRFAQVIHRKLNNKLKTSKLDDLTLEFLSLEVDKWKNRIDFYNAYKYMLDKENKDKYIDFLSSIPHLEEDFKTDKHNAAIKLYNRIVSGKDS